MADHLPIEEPLMDVLASTVAGLPNASAWPEMRSQRITARPF
jgi:hypothetical protein